MAFEQNELSGSLFKNDRRTNDRQPTHTGSCKIEGVDYWISAWVKEGKKGKFFSLSFTAKDQQPQAAAPSSDNYDEDIPF